ncbi:MAG: copper chaperone PCu(A)C [Anaerolineae bacterium]|nr:copper chaperone PCu(A)C [Anaerolineae bacterium]
MKRVRKAIKIWIALFALLISVLSTAAQCGSLAAGQIGGPPRIMVTEARAGAAVMGTAGSVYFKLTNGGGSSDYLLSVASGVAEAAEARETVIEADGMERMEPISRLEVPPGGLVNFETGGKHVMLINLKQDLVPGDKLRLTLAFEKSGPITIEAEIRDWGAMREHNM